MKVIVATTNGKLDNLEFVSGNHQKRIDNLLSPYSGLMKVVSAVTNISRYSVKNSFGGSEDHIFVTTTIVLE